MKQMVLTGITGYNSYAVGLLHVGTSFKPLIFKKISIVPESVSSKRGTLGENLLQQYWSCSYIQVFNNIFGIIYLFKNLTLKNSGQYAVSVLCGCGLIKFIVRDQTTNQQSSDSRVDESWLLHRSTWHHIFSNLALPASNLWEENRKKINTDLFRVKSLKPF